MSERMTDERMAEIESFFRSQLGPLGDELLRALKAERAEVERLESPIRAARVKAESQLTDVKASLAYLALMKRADAAEVKLAKVLEGLKEIRHEATECGSFAWIVWMAGELITEVGDAD